MSPVAIMSWPRLSSETISSRDRLSAGRGSGITLGAAGFAGSGCAGSTFATASTVGGGGGGVIDGLATAASLGGRAASTDAVAAAASWAGCSFTSGVAIRGRLSAIEAKDLLLIGSDSADTDITGLARLILSCGGGGIGTGSSAGVQTLWRYS